MSIADCPICHRGSKEEVIDKARRIGDYLQSNDSIEDEQLPKAILGLHFMYGHDKR